jgi:hypothetical protein
LSGPISAIRFADLIALVASAASLVNTLAETATPSASWTFEPEARRSPASTERVSVAVPPAASVATVWTRVAPAGASMVAVNEPSAASVAVTSLTLTLATAAPVGFGATMPVTTIEPARSWIRLRAGEVTCRSGGSGCGPPPPTTHAVSRMKMRWRIRSSLPARTAR